MARDENPSFFFEYHMITIIIKTYASTSTTLFKLHTKRLKCSKNHEKNLDMNMRI